MACLHGPMGDKNQKYWSLVCVYASSKERPVFGIHHTEFGIKPSTCAYPCWSSALRFRTGFWEAPVPGVSPNS